MTREQQKRLNEIDHQILLYGLGFQNLIIARGQIDLPSTLEFIDTFAKGLKQLAKKPQ